MPTRSSLKRDKRATHSPCRDAYPYTNFYLLFVGKKKLLPLPREGGRLARPEGFSADLELLLCLSVKMAAKNHPVSLRDPPLLKKAYPYTHLFLCKMPEGTDQNDWGMAAKRRRNRKTQSQKTI